VRIAVGCDHAGFELKQSLATYLGELGHAVVDVGTHSTVPVDYPDYAEAVGAALRQGRADRGILICGSGRSQQAAGHPCRSLSRHLLGPSRCRT
jgi:RpiB/LacA/LacB family sugar-phosphate isomerase